MGLINRSFRNVWRKKTRTFLVVIALGFSIAAIMSVYTGIEASTINTQKMIDEYEQHIIETGELSEYQERLIQVSSWGWGNRRFGGRPEFPRQFTQNISAITEETIENISEIDYVEAVIPLIERPMGEINIEEMREQMRQAMESGEPGFPFDGESPPREDMQNRQDIMMSLYDYIVMGVPVDTSLDETYSILPSNIVTGRKITEDDELMVMIREESTFADGFFTGVGVGDMVSINETNFTVAGIYSSDINRNYVYMDIPDAQKALGLEDGEVLSLNVYVEDKSVVDMVLYEIEEIYPDLQVISYADMGTRFSELIQLQQGSEIASLQEDSSKIENTGNTIIIVMIIAVALIVLFLMMYTVKERTKEIGLMKAIGFKGKSIMSQFIIEGTAIGILGGITGIIIGIIAGPFLSKLLLPSEVEVFATSTPSFSLILFALCLTVALGAVGTIYPAWQASRKSPMEAMRNE